MSSVAALLSDLLEHYRIVDLSEDVTPGVMKPDGHYRWGNGRRKFELRQWISPGGHLQSFVDTGSHVGTHVDMPMHIHEGARSPSGKELSAADMPLEAFFGEAIVLGFPNLSGPAGERAQITPAQLGKVKPGDIVLIWSNLTGHQQPNVGIEAAKMLAALPIRMIGVQNVTVDYDAHVALLGKSGAPIPIIEELAHLGEVTKERVLYWGLPMRVHDLDASWIRAIAFEPKD
jgi:kynurenine formamidase